MFVTADITAAAAAGIASFCFVGNHLRRTKEEGAEQPNNTIQLVVMYAVSPATVATVCLPSRPDRIPSRYDVVEE